jgi:PelA/Pel-15E family pectate lyase
MKRILTLTALLLAGSLRASATDTNVVIVLVGDSTVNDGQGWGPGFKKLLQPGVRCINWAQNGRSSRSFIAEGWWEKALAEKPDYVLTQFGHNDMPGKGPERETDPATTYREFLARYVDEARAAGATPVLITSLTRRLFGDDGKIHSNLGDYAGAAKKVAEQKNAPLLDLHTLSIELLDRLGPEKAAAFNPPKTSPSDKTDRTHLSPQGAEVFGEMVARALVKAVPSTAPCFRAAGPPSLGRAGDYLKKPDEWYAGEEGRRIAANVLSWQSDLGGWPKNVNTASPCPRGAKRSPTFDNGATTDELRFLARAFGATGDVKAKQAIERGVDYILAAQYPTGGWPQFHPPGPQYHRHITFNDGAMVRILELLRETFSNPRFAFLDAKRRRSAEVAFRGGIQCILKCQVRVNGELTAWCAQHDEVTLEPRGGRAFEPASISGCESVGIVRLLMSLEDPSPDIALAIESAVTWFRKAALTGIRVEIAKDRRAPGGEDKVVLPDASAPPIWARFYEIESNRPLFADRDGVVEYDLSAIGHERRNGYAWYGNWPAALIEKDYPAWKRKRSGG